MGKLSGLHNVYLPANSCCRSCTQPAAISVYWASTHFDHQCTKLLFIRLRFSLSDLFEKVVPLAVHGAMMQFENRRVEMVNTEIGRLREATQLMNSVMASLNLPAAIEDLSGNSWKSFPFVSKHSTVSTEGTLTFWSRLNVTFDGICPWQIWTKLSLCTQNGLH